MYIFARTVPLTLMLCTPKLRNNNLTIYANVCHIFGRRGRNCVQKSVVDVSVERASCDCEPSAAQSHRDLFVSVPSRLRRSCPDEWIPSEAARNTRGFYKKTLIRLGALESNHAISSLLFQRRNDSLWNDTDKTKTPPFLCLFCFSVSHRHVEGVLSLWRPPAEEPITKVTI